MKGRKMVYTPEQLEYISSHRTLPLKTLLEAFKKQFNREDINKDNLKQLKLRNGWLTGRTGRYKKGNIPHPNAKPNGPNKTSFKKGHKPANHLPVGTERVNSDGYLEIKIKEGTYNWKAKQRIVWEKHHGELKTTDVIRFEDGNKQNCNINNLFKVNRSEHAILNAAKYKEQPGEIKPTVLAIARVNSRIKQLSDHAQPTGAAQ